MRAGRIASIRSRKRRASTGDAPPVPIATTTSPRSTTAGKMNVDRSGRSTTLTGMLNARALAAMRSSMSRPAAETTASAPARSDAAGSPNAISIRPA